MLRIWLDTTTTQHRQQHVIASCVWNEVNKISSCQFLPPIRHIQFVIEFCDVRILFGCLPINSIITHVQAPESMDLFRCLFVSKQRNIYSLLVPCLPCILCVGNCCYCFNLLLMLGVCTCVCVHMVSAYHLIHGNSAISLMRVYQFVVGCCFFRSSPFFL